MDPRAPNNYTRPTIPRPSAADSNEAIAAANSTNNNSAIRIDGWEEDELLSKSEFLTREEVLKRRARRVKQLAAIYRDQYWVLMEELKQKHKDYYWEFGKSPFEDDNNNEEANPMSNRGGNGENGQMGDDGSGGIGYNRCRVNGCKSKAMALTKFCFMHILSDPKQKLYKACNYAIKSSPTGPIVCGKPILKSAVPSLCSLHFQKAEKHVARALKKAGLNSPSTSKVAPKFHVIVSEYVRQIQNKRRAAQQATREIVEIKEENNA